VAWDGVAGYVDAGDEKRGDGVARQHLNRYLREPPYSFQGIPPCNCVSLALLATNQGKPPYNTSNSGTIGDILRIYRDKFPKNSISSFFCVIYREDFPKNHLQQISHRSQKPNTN
jgi:hypothetical protein